MCYQYSFRKVNYNFNFKIPIFSVSLIWIKDQQGDILMNLKYDRKI